MRARENKDALFEQKLDDMNAAIEKNKYEIQDIFNKMREDYGEMKRTLKSIASKLDIINIMLWGHLIFLGFGILALLFIIKKLAYKRYLLQRRIKNFELSRNIFQA